eukprot:gb/GECG01008991.1/.p1 GENE.gb/GECG01008991.1/~~gb/GECG01008991.1/.p1  ORF type:complete len:1103 (+),score=148.60 gb/GECG01008991.1/:1-3309(+)
MSDRKEEETSTLDKLNCIGRIHMRLKYKLLLSTMGTIGIGTGIALIAVAMLLVTSFPDWTESTEKRMLDAEEDSLERLVAEKAQFADLFYKRVAGDLDGMCTYTQDIWRGAVKRDSTKTIDLDADAAMSNSALNRIKSEPGWDESENWNPDFSGWYGCEKSSLSSNCLPVSSIGGLDSNDQDVLEKSEPLRLIYKAIWDAGFPRHSEGFYGVAFDDSLAAGTATDMSSVVNSNYVHWYPYFDALNFENTEISECELIGGTDGFLGFTPYCRKWYANAVNADRTDKIEFTPPYIFAGANGGLGVTASRRVKEYSSSISPGIQDPGSPTGKLGVCMTDFNNADVDTTITGEPIINEGFGFMITGDATATVAYSGINFGNSPKDPPPIWDLVFGESDKSDDKQTFRDMIMNTVINNVEDSDERRMQYQRGGNTWFIAWSAVPTPDYIVALTVPDKDIREPVDEAKSEINNVIAILIGVSAAVFLVVGAIIFILTKKLAGSIVEPIYLLTQLVKKINKRQFDKANLQSFVDVTDPRFVTRELASLDSIFRQMFTAVRAGEGSIIKGELKEAETVFNEAMELFRRLGHIRGMGVCYTNLGAVYLMNGFHDRAIAYFRDAVQNATDLLEHSQVGAPTEDAATVEDSAADPEPSSGVLKRSKTTQFTRMLREARETVQFRKINLAKALLAKALYTIQHLCPREYSSVFPKHPVTSASQSSSGEEQSKILADTLKDLKEVARLGMESLHDLADAKVDRVKLLDARADVLRALVEAMEFEALIAAKSGNHKELVVGGYYKAQADEELAKMLQDIQIVWQEQDTKAKRLYTRAKDNDEKVKELQNAKYFAMAAHARFLLAEKQTQHCVNMLHHIFSTSETMGGGVLRQCAEDMSLALYRLGHVDAAKKVRQESCSGLLPPRNFCFLLDTSGSMANLIDSAVDNLARLYDQHVKHRDSLAVFTYDTTARLRIPKRKKGTGKQAETLRNDIKALNKVQGLTACYDAIWLALDELKDADTKTEDIIVCLTDGSDNRSKHKLNDLCRRIKRDYYDRVMVIVIALGSLRNRDDLRNITRMSKHGAFIEAAAGIEEMDQAFHQVSEAISSVSVRIESM